MNYLFNDKKDLVQADGNTFKEITCVVGQDYWIDGIQVVCIKAGNALAMDDIYLIDGPHSGDIPIFVDKNHDLSFYVKGSDFVDSNDYNQSPGTFGYEWGGYNTTTGIANTAVGTGLTNTNTLIGMNLQPNSSGWWVVWDKVRDFRNSYGHNWFIPSADELNLIYEVKNNLNSLSLNTNYYYWSSSEHSNLNSRCQSFIDGSQAHNRKYTHSYCSRLCRQIDN